MELQANKEYEIFFPIDIWADKNDTTRQIIIMEKDTKELFNQPLPRGGVDAITGFKDPTKVLKLTSNPPDNFFAGATQDATYIGEPDHSAENLRIRQDKYYTPDIEDIRVGYECEYSTYDGAFHINQTDDIKIGSLTSDEVIDILQYCVRDGKLWQVRTPYLTKEQIEKEGWLHTGGKLLESADQTFEKEDYQLTYSTSRKRLWIYKEYTIFNGTCSSINEFRLICKFLNIK